MMARDDKTVEPPSLSSLAGEGRGLLDIPALLAAAPLLATAPRGQPHPVVVLPGLGADDLGLLRYAVRLDSRYAVWAFAEGQHADLPSITLTNINR